jgi:hypothetical protein
VSGLIFQPGNPRVNVYIALPLSKPFHLRSILLFQNNQVKKDVMDRAFSTYSREECMQGLAGKARSRESNRKIQTRRVDNIKMYLREILSDGMDWICLAQDRDQ